MIIKFIFCLLLCLKFIKSQSNCLSYVQGMVSDCLACASGYYSEEFLLTAGRKRAFASNSCQTQIDSNYLQEKSFFVADSNFQDELESNGSITRPFKNFFDALIAAQQYAQSLRSSKIIILLIKSSDKVGPQEYFWSPAGSNEIYHFFRRVNANITIKPLFCSEQNVKGCFLTENPRPVLYLRSERQFIFVTNILRLESLIVDGSDISFENLSSSTQENYNKKLFCDENAISNFLNGSSDTVNETSSNCYLMKKVSNPNPKSFALFNIEPIFDCPTCLKQPSMVSIKNCEFRYIHSFSQNPSSLSALISAQRLRFSAILINSTIIKSNLPAGVFVSTGEWTPDLYTGAESLYIQAVGNQLTDRDQNVIIFSNSSIAYYDYFDIQYPSGTRGIFLMRSLAFQLIVNGSFFFKNFLLPEKIESVFFINNMSSNEQDIFFKLTVENNIIESNSILNFLNFQRVNPNYNGNRYSAFFDKNKFTNNIDCGIMTSMMDINISNSLVQGINLFNSSFLTLNVGRVFLRNVTFTVIKIASTKDLALIGFIGPSPDSEYNLFKTSKGSSLNLTRESVKIENSIFMDIVARIEYTQNTLNYLQVYNSTFKAVGSTKISVFSGSVEDNFFLTDCYFENVKGEYIFFLKYSRSHTISNVSLIGINSFRIIYTITYAESSPYPIHDVNKLIVKHSVINSAVYYVSNFYTKSRKIFKFYDCVFENITLQPIIEGYMGFILFIGLSETTNMTNCLFNSNKGDLLNLIQIEGTTSTSVLCNYSILNSTFIQNSKGSIKTFLKMINFKALLIKYCKFIGETKNSGTALNDFRVAISYPRGKLRIENTVFKGLRGDKGGATIIRLWAIEDLLVDSCQFIENTGDTFAADLILNFIIPNSAFRNLTLKDNFKSIIFGIRNNLFVSSQGIQGGAVFIMDRGQGFIFNNTFINTWAQFGGVIGAVDQSETVFVLNTVRNSSAIDEGGAVWALNCKILISENSFHTTKAKTGGVIFFQNVTAVVYYSDFTQSYADFGGNLFVTASKIKLRSLEMQNTIANIKGGSMVFIKSEISLELLKISLSLSEGTGGAIYINSPQSLYAINITISYSRAGFNGVLTLLGRSYTKIILKNLIFFQTSSHDQGDCLFISDTEVSLINLSLFSVSSITSAIFVLGTNFRTSFTLENSTIFNFTFNGSLYKASNSEIFLRNNIIRETNSINGQMALSFERCNIIIIWLSFDGKLDGSSSGRIIRADSSNVSLEALEFRLSRRLGALLFLSCDNVMIINSEFVHALPELENQGGVILLRNSKLTFSNSTIMSAEAFLGASIYSENSNLTILESYNFQSTALEAGALLYSIKTNSELKCIIVLNNVRSLGSRGNELSIFNNDDLIIRNYEFKKSSMNVLNGSFKEALRLENVNFINLENLLIEEFFGFSPVSIFTDKGHKSQLLFNQIIIKKSLSYQSGGGIKLYGSFFGKINNSSFHELNTNDSGGALYFSCPSLDCSLLIENCQFHDLIAKKYGGLLKSEDPGIIFGDNNKFGNISAVIGSMTVGQPSRIYILNKDASDLSGIIKSLKKDGLVSADIATEIDEVVSGQPFNLKTVVLDEFNNTMLYENSGKITITSEDNATHLENEFAFIRQGIALFNSFKINSFPGNTSTINLVYTNLINSKTFTTPFRLNLRRCIRGEILSGKTCQKCPRGFYSIEDDPLRNNITVCLICPVNAECPGGHGVFPAQGFWRKDENQSHMAKCLVEDSCPGGGLMNVFGYYPLCGPGYDGKLCIRCKRNYGYNSEQRCLKCSENPEHFVKFILLTIISLLMIVYQTQKAFEINTSSSKSRALFKILVDHFSYVSFISTFRIEWSSIALNMISIGDQYFTTVPKEMFNFDCFITMMGAYEQKFLINFLLISLTPIVYGIVCSFILIFFLIFKRKLNISKIQKKGKSSTEVVISTEDKRLNDSEPNQNMPEVVKPQLPNQNNSNNFFLTSQLVSMIIIIFYNFYPRIMLNAVDLLNCVRIDDSNKTYMVRNIGIECWGTEHTTIVIVLVLSNIFVWGIATPLLLYYLTKILINIEKRTNNINIKKLIDFITLDYKPKYFYWDLCSYFTKFLLVLLNVVTNPLEIYSQGSLITLFILLLFLLQEKLKPYNYTFVNDLKTLSYITTICSAAFAIMASNKKADNSQKLACVFISILSTFAFYIAWAYHFLRVMKESKAEKKSLRYSQKGEKNSKIIKK